MSYLENFIDNLENIISNDPAIKKTHAKFWQYLEVILCYPGLHAILVHRISHYLYKFNIPLLPRIISQIARFFTGIEIHPGAKVGKNFFIDHGMGVVVGETSVIGDNVLIYHGVTLGGSGKEINGRRHPKIGNGVVIGAGSQLIGPIEIGDDARIGAGAVIVSDVGDGKVFVPAKSKEISKKLIDLEYYI